MGCERWKIAGYDRPTAVNLYRQGFPSLVAVLLASRGIATAAEYHRLYDGADGLSDPMTLTDMDRATARIQQALTAGERIAVFGDYDVDGMTASTMLCDYLRGRGGDVINHVPERLTDGYGLKNCALDALKRAGAALVITVDCGITAQEEAAYAKTIELDLVITDHHQVGETLPQAVAVVNPKRDGAAHSCYDMAGVGVAFKLISALEGPDSGPRLLERYGDLVALGTVADVMPVLGENRLVIRRGLEILAKSPHPGLRALIRAAGLNTNRLDATSLGFVLAPRLNAAGRLGETGTAVRLLATRDEAEAEALADHLCELNRQRQTIEAEVLAEATAMLPPAPTGPLVVARKAWHQGVVGIVASKLMEQTRYPAVVICVQEDGMAHGSCRAEGDFDLVRALTDAKPLLENFGGHHSAAGLTVREENIPALARSLQESYVNQGCSRYAPCVAVDFEVTRPAILTMDNVEALDMLAPYGSGNPQPVLLMRDAEVDMVIPLRGGKVTKLWLRWEGESFEAIAFGRHAEELTAQTGDRVDLVFTPNVNEFRGRRGVQLVVKALRPHRPTPEN